MNMLIDLKEFCDSTRERFATPFIVNGFLCATDGAICVRCHAPEPVTIEDEIKRPDVNSIIEKYVPHIGYGYVPIPPYVACDSCMGTGIVKTTAICEDCDGFGEYECRECGNIGSCRECDGTGRIEEEHDCVTCCIEDVPISSGETLAGKYANLLAKYGATSVFRTAEPDTLVFTFAVDGITYTGVVMTKTEPSAEIA